MRTDRLLGGALVDRRHAGHLVADEAHVIGRERLLVVRPGDDAVLEGQLVAGQRRDHARQLEGLADVDAADARVGVRRAQQLGVQHARKGDVVGVDAGPVGLGDAIDLGEAVADAHGTISVTVCALESLAAARSDCTGARDDGVRSPAATSTAS